MFLKNLFKIKYTLRTRRNPLKYFKGYTYLKTAKKSLTNIKQKLLKGKPLSKTYFLKIFHRIPYRESFHLPKGVPLLYINPSINV